MKKSMIIGEVAQAHDGSLGMAHAFIDAIANAGADAVKFQTHIAYAESMPDEPWRVKFSPQDDTRYQYWQRMEFTEEQWMGLKTHAEDKNLVFLSSAFSHEAVDLLDRLGMTMWKVASGEVNNLPLLDHMTTTRKPIILSSGMSTLEELDKVVDRVQAQELPLTVLQCTTSYPCPPEEIGINMLSVFRDRYQCNVGLSDHSGTIYPGLAAATLGSDMLEVHVTFSREMFGPDVTASVTTTELKEMVEGIRFIETMLANPIDKNQIADQLKPLRKPFTKSIIVKEALAAGTVLQSAHLTVKKPGTGIPAMKLPDMIGRRLKIDVQANTRLAEDMLE